MARTKSQESEMRLVKYSIPILNHEGVEVRKEEGELTTAEGGLTFIVVDIGYRLDPKDLFEPGQIIRVAIVNAEREKGRVKAWIEDSGEQFNIESQADVGEQVKVEKKGTRLEICN
ncbi:hypothetical protein A2872_01540 [Candidatus Gottesmanbacteria bacterium RIFCSPHIGHO2_01_FULL_42_12]|uniref:Uncharacterized protein n=1 Tax=Candidatus Gottesmanbacteria bacterium RIFCSPHIGHO2_01_FULL_42_12 TaxID=1798377 RepID=A0A1F5Z494_9BACT|nr:MAG: hypothetical protein A2872_01540 [Candidatus Gottesmanbacteria bacterium RIFCSPHIGHO2_01_FULL_42_12]